MADHEDYLLGPDLGDMLKSVYDLDENGIVDDSQQLQGSTKLEVQHHTPASHIHAQADIANLATVLAGKAPLSHYHTKIDITDHIYMILSLQPDSAPYTSGAMEPLFCPSDGRFGSLHNDLNWMPHYSYAFNLGQQRQVSNIYCSCYTAVFSSSWYGPNNDSVQVFKSNDNSTWTLVEQFDAPPITQISTFFLYFTLSLATPQPAQYFKVVAIDPGALAIGIGGMSIKLRGISFD